MTTARTQMRRIATLYVALALLAVSIVVLSAPRVEAAYPGGNGWIVFESGFDLWAMASDGSGSPVNLTTSGEAEADPVFSPDGTKIALSRDVSGSADIWTAAFDPSGPSLSSWTKVSNGGVDGQPTWSPDAGTIAFERMITWTPVITGAHLVTTANPAGTVLIDATANFTTNVTPGMDVVNTTDGSSGQVLSVDSPTQITLKQRLVGGTENDWDLDDGYAITSSRLQLFTVPAAGPAQAGTQISAPGTTPAYDDTSPAWSPVSFANGKELIAFGTNRNGNYDIYVIQPDGTVPSGANLTPDPTFDNHALQPSWAPDGTELAFHTPKPGNADTNIWRLALSVAGSGTVSTVASSDVTGSATAGDNDYAPAWSPDGAKIAFVRGGTGGDKTYTINPDGSGLALVNTATSPAVHDEPDWRPTLISADDAYGVDEGGTLVEAAPGVLDNDTLVPALGTATAVKDTDPAHGTVTLNSDGSFTYTHDGLETTTDSFTYHPVQGSVAGSPATVTITIDPVNDAPVAVDDGPYNVVHGGSVSEAAPGVLANDTDAEGDVLTAVNASTPAHGTVTLNVDGSFVYTHSGDSATSDSFTYQAKDTADVESNVATVSFTIGDEPPPVVEIHATGLVDPLSGKWYLYDSDGVLTTSFFFGNPGDYPFMGDWDGDGIETPGLYRQSDGYVYLRNTNTQGVADIKFFFGNPGDVPIAGDFNNDGFDTVSIYRPSNQTFYIINKLGSGDEGLGAADFFYVFGNPGDKPFVGDFNGNGEETVGLHRETTGLVYFRNTHTQGNADAQFLFGDPGDRLVAGDWTGDGTFTPALFRPSNTTMYFRWTNTQGNADNQYIPTPTNPAWLPVSGKTN